MPGAPSDPDKKTNKQETITSTPPDRHDDPPNGGHHSRPLARKVSDSNRTLAGIHPVFVSTRTDPGDLAHTRPRLGTRCAASTIIIYPPLGSWRCPHRENSRALRTCFALLYSTAKWTLLICGPSYRKPRQKTRHRDRPDSLVAPVAVARSLAPRPPSKNLHPVPVEAR